MRASFFQKVFANNKISIVVPNEKEQDFIHHKLMTEIELGQFLEGTRNALLRIVRRMLEEDTTNIHVKSAITYCLND